MLNKIINSQARLAILDLFFSQPSRKYYNQQVTEITSLNAGQVLRELNNLTTANFLKKSGKNYSLNKRNPYYKEFKNIFNTYTHFKTSKTNIKISNLVPQKKLISDNISLNQSKTWYNQRFDGCPGFILMISIAELTKEERKLTGGEFISHVVSFKRDVCDWFIDQEDINRVSNLIIKKSLTDSHISKKFLKTWKNDEQNFFSACKDLEKVNLSELSDNHLLTLYKDFVNTYLKTITSSSLIDGFALGTDELIKEKLEEFLTKKKLAKKQYEYFTILTAPTSQSFINEAEISLLETALNKKSTTRHQQEYFWSMNNYVHNNILTVEHFNKEIEALKKGQVDIKKEITRLKKTPIKNKQIKEKLLKELNPPQVIKNLITISDDFTAWQDERKHRTYLTTHYLSLLLDEIGQRKKYTLHQMKYLLPNEVASLFTDKPLVSKKEADARLKYCLFYQKGNSYEILSGPKAKKAQQEIFATANEEEVDDFRGLPACRGVVKGKVKIVKSATEIKKIKEGDILVAVMTRPDYIAGMKKAKAIITDEGGVTCHAAIVSRELQIPCIIATKIATKALKDGDIVEVNANHGIIKIIK